MQKATVQKDLKLSPKKRPNLHGFKCYFDSGNIGGCQKNELVCMRTEGPQNWDASTRVNVPNTKTKIARLIRINLHMFRLLRALSRVSYKLKLKMFFPNLLYLRN